MFRKYLNYSNLLISGVVLSIIGIIMMIANVSLLKLLVAIIPISITLIAIANILKYLENKEKYKSNLITGIIDIIIAIIIILIPKIPFYFFPMLCSIYMLINAIIKFVSYYILRMNNVKNRVSEFVQFIICFIFSILFIIIPYEYSKYMIIIIGLYLLLLGITYISEYLSNVLDDKYKNKFKRKIRITLPQFMLAIIPYNTLIGINKYLKTSNEDTVVYNKAKEEEIDLEIFIHVTKSGFGMIGHADFCFNNKVYSYGNYDVNSLKLFEMIGNGVLFITDKKDEYIKFCIEHSKKTLFCFGIKLTEKQKKKIQSKIDKIMENTYDWNIPKIGKKSYVHYLYNKTKAKFYKFNSGKFKTYFTVGNNCVKLVDEVVGLDILDITGIISPGTYYEYLETEFLRKNSNVISYKVYNKESVDKIIKNKRKTLT